MATNKPEAVAVATFSKEQILASSKYGIIPDVVNVVLKDGELYTLEQVDNLIDEFNRIEVK